MIISYLTGARRAGGSILSLDVTGGEDGGVPYTIGPTAVSGEVGEALMKTIRYRKCLGRPKFSLL